MVDTPNDIATHVEAESVTKVDAINAAFDAFDISVNDDVSVVSDDSLVTVTSAEFLDNGLIVLTSGATGAWNLDVPDGKRRFAVINNSGHTVTIDTVTGGTTVAAQDGVAVLIHSTGTDLEEISSSTPTSGIFGRQIEVWPASSMYFPVTQPAGTAAVREVTVDQPNVAYIPFDPTTEERMQFGGVPFPNRYDQSTIRFQVGYTHDGTQTGGLDGVVWQLAAVSIPDDGSFDVPFGTRIQVDLDRANGNDVHRTAESGLVTIGGTLGDGNTVFFEISRDVVDGLDDLDIDAQLLWVRIIWDEDSAVDD
jgi:hypothetical protein